MSEIFQVCSANTSKEGWIEPDRELGGGAASVAGNAGVAGIAGNYWIGDTGFP
ncbi:MAG: hypothetical protein ACTHUY_01120 [Flaviflexus sp.]|uniref:hypothetical protein n=1 Tax=Flaviflexus sp. TaxID=1969482 RepID=UPI003F906554